MAANPGGNWKHTSGPAKPSGTPAAGTSRRAWQPGAAKPKGPAKPRSRGSKFLITGFFAALLLGAIIAVILLWKPAHYPELVLVAPAQSDGFAVPFSGPGTQTVNALGEWTKTGSNRPKLAAPPDELANADKWKSKITGDGASTVLYFAAAGGADAEGPFLWFVDPAASAPAETDKIRVKDIIARLGGLKASHPKLLVFDLARMPVSWAHGNFFADFAHGLKELDAEIAKIENLVVICSCDADETAWSSEELRETVFGHFLRLGVSGAAGTSEGERLNVAKVFDYAKEQTSKWASVNRDEKQTPILLPATGGTDRAAKWEVATKSNSEAAKIELAAPEKAPAVLDELWKRAETLAGRTPAPDTTDPAKWREFLETLLRWEQAIRFGRNQSNLQAKAQALGDQLAVTSGGVEPLAVGLGLKVGPALGFPVPKPRDEFRALWNPPAGSTRAEEYDKLPNAKKSSFRLAVAAQILDEVSKTGSAEDLAAADELLSLMDGSQIGAAETHFVRMLARHLDTGKRPPVRLIQEAIKLARTAEDAALSAAYSEQVARWIAKDIDAGDASRRLAEDCLFAADDASYADALTYSNTAAKSYKTARETADTVMAALALRDYTFARLPYYGRWIAGYRGQLPPEDVKALVKNVEEAARFAHDIAEIALSVPEETKAKLDELRDKTASLKSNMTALESAYTAEAGKLSNTVSQQNWHAIEGVLSVPFLKAEDRSKLFGFLRSISYTLAQQQQQPTATGVPPLSPQESASRQLRIGRALANDRSSQTQALLEQPNPAGWWLSFRQVADSLGKSFRALPGEMKQLSEQAATKPLTEAAPLLARASYKSRLADPAAPCTLAEAPTTAEQRYWQHKLLLNQARRTTGDGWAGIAPGPPNEWYCRKAAANYIASAQTLIGGGGPPLSPPEAARRFAECTAEAARLPAELTVTAADTREVADEPKWVYPFTIAKPKTATVGYPVYWITEPGEPYHAPSKNPAGRTRVVAFVKANVESTKVTRDFTAPAKPVEKAEPGKLAATVLYRGHLYEKPTRIVLAGTPSLDIHQAPASGDARFAVISDPDAVAGAVTIMIDLTLSMNTVISLNRKRIEEALAGVERLLKDIPPGTTVTIGSFYGNADFTGIKTAVVYPQIKLTGTADQRDEIMKVVNRLKAEGETTPLAGAIREVISPDTGKKFWPKVFTGTRTLIVVTDGEDNWAKPGSRNYYRPAQSPADMTIDALRGATDDVALHIVFFGMVGDDAEEQKRAFKQFQPIEDIVHFRAVNRTPAKLYQDVKDADALGEKLKGAMLPTIPFTEQNERSKDGERRVPVTLNKELVYRLSPPLKKGAYHLWAATPPQQLQLDAGDRVLLEAKLNRDGKLELGIPPIAYDLAGKILSIPRGISTPPGNRIPLRMTLPEFDLKPGTETCDLRVTATLESSDSKAGAILYREPPLFAWFDATYADGQPANPKYKSSVRIDNRPGLFAPAWSLQLKRWDADRGRDATRKPSIAAHWIERLPQNGLPIPVDMRNVAGAKDKMPVSNDVQGINVEIESIGVETWEEGTLHPQGQYLTVRLKYPNPAGKVFLRPGQLGGTNQAGTLHERHTYYDAVGRYTARFGPISKEDETISTQLMLYSVSELRKVAADVGRAVTVTFPDRSMVPYAMPDFLQPK